MIFYLIFAALVGWATLYLSESPALAIAVGIGVALLQLARRARAMWREAHD